MVSEPGSVWRALHPGTQGAVGKVATPSPHVHGEPGAKSFVDDLLLDQGFIGSRATPSL